MHKPVLLKETIDALELGPGETLLDGTLGGGGHTREALRRYPGIRVIGLDQDPSAISNFQETISKQFPNSKFEIANENFRNLDKVLRELGVERVDAILLDIGFSSDQLESEGRGFSFQKDEPLDMRMSKTGPTAADLLNGYSEEALELVLRGFGEERHSREIAREIVRRREEKPFKTTQDLVEAVEAVKPKRWFEKIHPATLAFQALRIAVNEELTALEEGLEKGFEVLTPGGRFAIISFHSLEDRIIKNFFRDRSKSGEARLITKKPITAQESEISENPRSRSAKLRVIEKI